MPKSAILSFIILLLLVGHTVHSDQSSDDLSTDIKMPGGDFRQLISMPDQARQLMQQDMLDHLSTLNEIVGYLADNDLEAAAEIAESRMGESSMGKHRATGMGPGKFMPLAMRNLGRSMHESASEFSKMAKDGDLNGAYSSLQKITTSCVACHYSFRTR